MITPWLFARARRTTTAIVAIAVITAVGLLARRQVLRLPLDPDIGVPLVTILPLASSCVVAMLSRSPMNELERVARPLAGWRALHLAALLALAAAGSLADAAGLPAPASWPSALRNLAGMAGLGLLTASVLGGRLAWVLPVAWTLAALSVGSSAGRPYPWAWPIQDDSSATAMLTAMLLLAAGGAAVIFDGTREPAGETD